MRLVFAMGFGDDEIAFLKELEMHCSMVHSRFQELFDENPEEGEDLESEKIRYGLAYSADAQTRVPFPAERFDALQETLKAYPVSVKSEIFLGALEKFSGVCDQELLEKILVRIDTYFERVARRTGLIKLFEAVKPWMAPFCRGIVSSELVASLLVNNPALVEGHAVLSGIFSPALQWEESSQGVVERAEEYEEKLEWIRRLKNERIIQLALADIGGRIDFAVLEEEQTSLADFVVRNTLAAVGQNLGLPADLPLSVLGMGKLGSGEMSYLSDLDLIFVYAPRAHEPANQIPAEVVRLIQRFMNMLYTPLQEGPGYPVDVRLRPSGTHGPLVVTRKSWIEYYEAQADIWEIQALLKVRRIAGDPELGQWIEDKAGQICCRKRSPESVWPRLCHLRNRMEKERAAETETEIDLKLGMGGLADIEFMAQAQMLVEGRIWEIECEITDGLRAEFGNSGTGFTPARPAYGGGRPAPRGSIRRAVQEFLKDSPIPRSGGTRLDELSSAFGTLRALDHRVRLHTNSSAAKLDERRFEAMVLLGLWPPHFDGSLIETWQDVLRLRRKIRGIFKRFCP